MKAGMSRCGGGRWRAALVGGALLAGCAAPSPTVEQAVPRGPRHAAEQQPRANVGVPVDAARADADRPDDGLPAGEILTLDRAREFSLRGNPDVHAALARLATATARADQANARYFPSLTFAHNSSRTFLTPESRNRLATLLQPATTVPTDLDTSSLAVTTLLNALRRPLFGPEGGGDSSSFSEHSTSFTATWTIFDGMIREAQSRSADLVRQAGERSLEDVKRLILRAVEAAYYQVQLAEERVRIAKADVQFSEEQAEETTKLHAAGRASATDVDNFRVRALSARVELSRAEGLRDVGRVSLAELMGLESATLPGELQLAPLASETAEDLQAPNEDEWLAAAERSRPDLRQMERLVRSEEENVRAARGLFLPTFAVSGSWGFDRSNNIEYGSDDQSAAVGVELRWDIWNGGAREAELAAAESIRQEAASKLKRLRIAIMSQVRSAVIELRNAQQQIRLQEENLALAADVRRTVRVAYSAGRQTLIRLNESQRDYIATDVGLATARIRLRQAWSELRAAASADATVVAGNE